MRNNILFIADGSITNPILHSQGIPFLLHLKEIGFNPYMLTLEDGRDKNKLSEAEAIVKRHCAKINFVPVTVKYNSFIPDFFLFSMTAWINILKITIKERISLLHARSFFPALFSLTVKFLLLNSVKVIFDNRGAFIDELILTGSLRKNSAKEKIFRWIEILILKFSDHIVVVSNKFRNFLLDSHQKKNLSDKITVISNRTKIYSFPQKTSSVENFENICIYSGSLAQWQNVDFLINIFKQAKQAIPNIRFKILTYNPELISSVLSRDLPPEITEIRKVASDEIPAELITGKFAVLLRKNHIVNRVSSPLKFGEYLAAGLPVILNEGVGDTEEIVKKYNVGVIIRNENIYEAIEQLKILLNDNQIKERCRDAAEKEFDIRQSFEQYKFIYEQLLHRS